MNKIQSYHYFDQIIAYSKYLFVAFLGVLFFIQFWAALNWSLCCDAAFLHYVAYLINEHDFVPYRDIFEVNMPGTYLFHMAIGKLFGYSAIAFRLVDGAWLLLTLLASWFFMKPFGRTVAFGSSFLFGLMYLKGATHFSLQREFIALLPILMALLIATRRKVHHSINLIHVLQGVLFAIVVLIKPHLVIGLPALILYNYFHFRKEVVVKEIFFYCIKGALFVMVGFFLTLLGPFVWIWQMGALPYFIETTLEFSPLYLQMTGQSEVVDTFTRIGYILQYYLRFGDLTPFLLSALFGLYVFLSSVVSSSLKKIALLLLSLIFLYSFYVILGGKFWSYHWLPFTFFVCLCAALLLYKPPTKSQLPFSRILPLIGFVLTVFNTHIVLEVLQELTAPQQPSTHVQIRTNEIADYLNNYVLPEDTVQPLDWIRGAVGGMLYAKKAVATRYITTFQFHLNVSNPYIKNMRKDFISSLQESMPTILIDVYERPVPFGIDTSKDFPELEAFIQQNYTKEYSGSGFDIYRKHAY